LLKINKIEKNNDDLNVQHNYLSMDNDDLDLIYIVHILNNDAHVLVLEIYIFDKHFELEFFDLIIELEESIGVFDGISV